MAVSSQAKRAHIVMPAELIGQIDERVGPRRRSQFVQEAVEEKLRRQAVQESLAAMAGSLADVDIPGWETPESASEWVRRLRSGEAAGICAQPDDEVA
jgi:hypothetical protein